MSAFPTLAKQPSYPLSPDGESVDMMLRTPTDAGYEQTRPKFTRAVRMWGVVFNALSDADVATVRTFELTTIANGSDSFSWTHPVTTTTYTVKLTAPIKYARSIEAAGASTVSFTLREV